MSYFAPLHPQTRICIGCGCKIGAVAKNNVKKAVAIGLKKAVDLWLNERIIVDYRNHKMCLKCYSNNGNVPKSSNGTIDLNLLVETLTAFIQLSSKSTSIETETKTEKQHIGFTAINLNCSTLNNCKTYNKISNTINTPITVTSIYIIFIQYFTDSMK